VGSPDLRPPHEANDSERTVTSRADLRTSLTPRTRSEIMHLTDNPHGLNGVAAVRAPVDGTVRLTPYGADAWFEGRWEGPGGSTPQTGAGVDLLAWTHRTRGGRDTFVKVVTAGWLYPYGFPAAQIEISEREFHHGDPRALLARRTFIVVRDPVRTLEVPGCPFVRFEVRTAETGLLDDPALSPSRVDGVPSTNAFWPRTAGRDVRFAIRTTDRVGHTVDLSTPVIFVRASTATQSTPMGQVAASWDGAPHRHDQSLHGATVAYTAAAHADTMLPTRSIRLGADAAAPNPVAVVAGGAAPFGPRMVRAEVDLPSIEALGGAAAGVALRYAGAWTSPFGNPHQVWAELEQRLEAGPAAMVSGGLTALALSVDGLAVGLGPIAAVDAFVQGDHLEAARRLLDGAKLLGGLTLSDLLDAATITSGNGEATPRLVFDPRTACATLDWAPTLDAVDLGFLTFTPLGSPQDHVVHAEMCATGGYALETRLRDFRLAFAGALELDFAQLGFVDRHDAALDLVVDLTEVRFTGPLTFIDALRSLLRFGNGLSIDVLGTDLAVQWRLDVPTMPVGMFELADLSVGTDFRLPMTGETPRLSFGISRRDAPFLVAVCGVGGGGWLTLELETTGLRALEVSLFAAGAMSLNLGVASGGVSLKVGVVFAYDGETRTATVTAFIEAHGALTVLGLITVSVTFLLALTYADRNGKAELTGTASLRVKVSVLFFSTSVTLSVTRTLAGSDPPFTAAISHDDWHRTQAAYA
jgi:hypothetical protein